MERELDRGKKKEVIHLIMMDKELIKEIMDKEGMTCSEIPTNIRLIAKMEDLSRGKAWNVMKKR
jgi:hypothetical protein